MIDPKYLKLIHRELDGELSGRQKRRLDDYLRENPEARRFYEDLRAMTDRLSAVEPLEPSPNLKKAILNQISTRPHPRPEERSRLRRLVDILSTVSRAKVGFAFAGGLITGLALFMLLSDDFRESSLLNIRDIQGTLVLEDPQGDIQAGPAVDIRVRDISGQVKSKILDHTVLIELQLSAEEPAEVEIALSAAALRLSGFVSRRPLEREMVMDDQALRFLHRAENHYTLLVNQTDGQLDFFTVRIFRGKAPIFEQRITTR